MRHIYRVKVESDLEAEDLCTPIMIILNNASMFDGEAISVSVEANNIEE